MNETSPSIWKRPWRGPYRMLAWSGLLALAIFVILYALGVETESAEIDIPALIAGALVLAALLIGAMLFVRWLCRWRNLRRFLFGVACCITFLALLYASENWRGKHAWQSYRRVLEAKGEPFTIAALIPPAVPDEKNFALTPLLKPVLDFYHGPKGIVWGDTNGVARIEKIVAERPARRDTNDHLILGSLEKGTFADVAACALFYRGNTNYPQAAAGATPPQEILTALGQFDSALKELHEAAVTRPESRFPIEYDYQPPWDILLPHLARAKSLTMLAHVHAIAVLESGQPGEAFEDLKLGLRLSSSIRNEPLLIDHLVRIATLAIDMQTLREGLVRHAWNDQQLTEVENYFASLNLLAEYKLAMRGERAGCIEGVDFLRRQGFQAEPMNYLADEEGASASAPPLRLVPGGWFYQNMVTISRLFEEFTLPTVDDRAHRVFPDLSEKGQRALLEMRRGPYTLFAKLFMPALQHAAQKSARMQTYADATRVACALERYRLANGELPGSLEALAPRFIDAIPNDVVDGKPLRYRLQSDGGYVLYSIGWNQTDDGGVPGWTKEKKRNTVDITRGDWVWQMAAK